MRKITMPASFMNTRVPLPMVLLVFLPLIAVCDDTAVPTERAEAKLYDNCGPPELEAD